MGKQVEINYSKLIEDIFKNMKLKISKSTGNLTFYPMSILNGAPCDLFPWSTSHKTSGIELTCNILLLAAKTDHTAVDRACNWTKLYITFVA